MIIRWRDGIPITRRPTRLLKSMIKITNLDLNIINDVQEKIRLFFKSPEGSGNSSVHALGSREALFYC